MKRSNPLVLLAGVALIGFWYVSRESETPRSPEPIPSPRPLPNPGPSPFPKPNPPPVLPKPKPKPWEDAKVSVEAKVGGNVAPDGTTEIHCDLPGELHRRNTTSRGSGCCVWTSIHHSALWQNIAVLQELPKYIQSKGLPGGSYPSYVARIIKQKCQEEGIPEPAYLQIEDAQDLEAVKLACKTGRMVAITYSRSPTGRYGGSSISHMVSLPHCDEAWAAVLDNNYIGADAYEWMHPEKELVGIANRGGYWAVIFLNPGPPPPPRNIQRSV